MFYNCPVRKLASHSPPSCEKKKKKKKQYTYKHTHSLAHTYSHVWTHTDSDIPAETYRLHKLLLVSHSLRRAQGEEWRQYYLSLSLYKSAGTCTPELGQDCQRLSSGHTASSFAMGSGSWL